MPTKCFDEHCVPLMESPSIDSFFIRENSFTNIPDEVLWLIFCFVPKMEDLLVLSKVCKSFFRQIQDISLWKQHCLKWWLGLRKRPTLDFENMHKESVSIDVTKNWRWLAN